MLGYQLPANDACEELQLSQTTPSPDRGSSTEDAIWDRLLSLSAPDSHTPADSLSQFPEAEPHALLDLYMPFCEPVSETATRVLGHLGQSVDGYIATASGDSSFVNDEENIRHLHRLRALHDAVIVGAGTVAADDPQLTTRRVPGPNPTRIVLDPLRRLSETARVFSDRTARTILITADTTSGSDSHGDAEVLRIPQHNGTLDLGELIARLRARGLRRIFVEGGGNTVTRFFESGLLDRIHIAVAPMFIGRGRPGLRLAPTDRMDDCPRPAHRLFAMGNDVLFDCELGNPDSGRGAPTVSVANGLSDRNDCPQRGNNGSSIFRIR